MKVLLYLVAAATIHAYALPNPKVTLEGENGITGWSSLHTSRRLSHLLPNPTNPQNSSQLTNPAPVNDDGSTSIDGETGITTNAAGQTTNVGGSGGITIGEPAAAAKSNSTTKGTGTSGGKKGNSTSSAGTAKGSGGAAGLAALIGALQGASGSGNTSSSGNGTDNAVGVLMALEGAK